MPKRIFLLIVVGIVCVVGIVVLSSSVYTIQYGTVGLLTRFGQVVGDPQDPGLHFKVPFVDNVVIYRTQKIVYQTLYSTNGTTSGLTSGVGDLSNTAPSADSSSQATVQNFTGLDDTAQTATADYQDVAIDTTTKDGQQIRITYSLRFSLDPTKIKDIANDLGTEQEVVDKIVKTDSRVWARNIPRNYSALDLYTGNVDKVSQEIKDALKPSFDQNGLILDEFFIRSIHFQDDYVQTIEQKQIEKEKISTEDYIAQQEEFKKQAAITKAQGDAEAQRLQQQTLTPQLIQKEFIDKWNGVLPTTMTGDASVLLNLLGSK